MKNSNNDMKKIISGDKLRILKLEQQIKRMNSQLRTKSSLISQLTHINLSKSGILKINYSSFYFI